MQRSSSSSRKPSTRETPPLSIIRSMRSTADVVLKNSSVFCTSRTTSSVTARSTGSASSTVAPSTGTPRFSCSAASKGQPQLFLHRFGVGVAANRDVAGEHRLVTLNDVDVDGAGAGIQQDHHPRRLEAIVGLECVLQREGIHVHHHRGAPRAGDDAGVVADLFLLCRDQQHVHAAARIGAGARVQHLVVEVDVLDVEWDVLLRLPVNRIPSSASVITGSVIFLTITVLPDSDAQTSLVLNALLASNSLAWWWRQQRRRRR